ncbi:MAG: hypothetical protein WAK03_06990, partial [Methylocystis sp.]
VLRGLFVEMEGLGLECGRKSLDLFHTDLQATGSEALAHGEAFEASPALIDPLSPLLRQFADAGVRIAATPSRLISGGRFP